MGLILAVSLTGLAASAFAADGDASRSHIRVEARSKSGLPLLTQGKFGYVHTRAEKSNQKQLQALALEALELVRPVLDSLSLKPLDLMYEATTLDPLGNYYCVFRQFRDGTQVVGSRVAVRVSSVGEVTTVSSLADGRPTNYHFLKRDMQEIKQIAISGRSEAEVVRQPELTYHISARDGRIRIVYRVTIVEDVSTLKKAARVFVDADSGKVVEYRPLVQNIASTYRRIFNAYGKSFCQLPNTYNNPPQVRIEGGSPHPSVPLYNTNYDHIGTFLSYLSTNHSYVGMQNLPSGTEYIYSSLNYYFYPQAAFIDEYYCGEIAGVDVYLFPQIVFSAAGVNDNSTGAALDIVGHEFSHGITRFSSGLQYYGEDGALNESFSDIMGASCEIWVAGSIGSNAWKIGDTVAISGTPFRYMDTPTSDGISTDFYPERTTEDYDNQGVHLNSGIANLAFKLLAAGGTHPRSKTSVSVTGIGISKAEKIFFDANVRICSYGGFGSFRAATLTAAANLYGNPSTEYTQTQNAWDAVGVSPTPGRVINCSVRSYVGTGGEVQILGFTLTGSGNRNYVIRALGAGLGLSGNLTNPQIELYKNGSLHASNDNWASDTNAGSLGGLAPANSNDPALYRNLDAAAYTVIVSGVSGGTGLCLVEVYEVSGSGAVRINNFSGRAKTIPPGTMSNALLIGGMVLSGSPGVSGGAVANDVVVRALGPTLSPYFGGGHLADPKIDMSGAGFLGLNPQVNDSWASAQSGYLTDASLAPPDSAEPALHGMPVPGSYSAILEGVGGTAGIGLLEFYILN